jgi:predicted GIY-YIG superfamily endonuclease
MSSPNDTTLYIGVTNDLERRVKSIKEEKYQASHKNTIVVN